MNRALLGVSLALALAAGTAAVPAYAAEMQTMGEHSMSGTITVINHKTGWLKLKTHEGVMRLHYPPSTVKELKKGEKITAHLSYSVEKK